MESPFERAPNENSSLVASLTVSFSIVASGTMWYLELKIDNMNQPINIKSHIN